MEEQDAEQVCRQPDPTPATQELQEQESKVEKQEMEPQEQVDSEKVGKQEAEPEKQEEAEPEVKKQEEVEPEVKEEEERVEPEVKMGEERVEPEVKKQEEAEPEVKGEEQGEPEVEKVEEPEKEVVLEKPADPEPEPAKAAEPEPEPQEPEPETPMPSVQVLEQKTEPVEQAAPEKTAEQQPEAEKPSEPEKNSEGGAEKTAAQEPGKPPEGEEKAEPEAVKEEPEPEAPAVAPGSLTFAFLEQEHTKAALSTSHTLFILRGLPGSGKSRLAAAISEQYKDICSVICADDHGVKPDNLAASADGLKALDKAVADCCSSGKAVVVVDDTNHAHGRLACLEELGEQHRYFVLFLEPRTEWFRDVEQLVKKTKRGLDKSQIQALKGPLEETSLPLFFGWFLCPTFKDKLAGMAENFLKTVGGLEDFKKHVNDFTSEAEQELNLEQYFQHTGALHCTTKFCDYGKAEGAKEYAENQSVRDLYGSMTELSLSTLFITPRTLGARVALTQEQLVLWPNDAEEEEPDLPPGSRAHVTLGCAEGVESVQTGLDLLEILQLQKQGQEGEKVQDLELGPLSYYGKGIWVLSLREPTPVPALFSSYYGQKKGEEPKKEEGKKKKLKCTIL